MDLPTLYDWLLHLTPYTPLIIFVATVLDIFFLTGLIIYGAAMLGSVMMLLMTGMISVEALFISAAIGSVVGNTVNYWIGRMFGATPIVKRTLGNPHIQKTERFLEQRGLLLFMTVGRFITFTRPLYALFLGSIGITFRQFIVREIPLACVWVGVWLLILLQGESLILKFF